MASLSKNDGYNNGKITIKNTFCKPRLDSRFFKLAAVARLRRETFVFIRFLEDMRLKILVLVLFVFFGAELIISRKFAVFFVSFNLVVQSVTCCVLEDILAVY